MHGPAFREFAGASIGSDKQKALDASPMGHLTAPAPPFLIMTGTADKLVAPQQSSQLYQALKAKNSDVKYILVEGAGHGDAMWYQPEIIEKVVAWFKAKLVSETTRTNSENPKVSNL